MKIENKDILTNILESISFVDFIKPGDIPSIDLYMDQVTTFMDDRLRSTKRSPEDKILTKTMINNYAKNNLLPPPLKKKYSEEHILILLFIYYFKNVLSIKDIESLLQPITEQYFAADTGIDITTIYEEIYRNEQQQIESQVETIKATYQRAQDSFANVETDDKEYLQLFSFICGLSFDVYLKKLIIEKLIDELSLQKDDEGKK